MSYANDPNLDPTQCLGIAKRSLDDVLNIDNSEKKLVLGGMIGPNNCNENWCDWKISHAEIAAQYVRDN